MYLYHHVSGEPFEQNRPEDLDHFGVLLPVKSFSSHNKIHRICAQEKETSTKENPIEIDASKTDKNQPGQILTRSKSSRNNLSQTEKTSKRDTVQKAQTPKTSNKTTAKPRNKKDTAQNASSKSKLNMLPKTVAKNIRSSLRKRSLPLQNKNHKRKQIDIEEPATKPEPATNKRAKKQPQTPSAVLDITRRRRLKALARTFHQKHSNDFATREDWPFFGGYYVTINQLTKNVSGNQKSLIKKRKKMQVNILSPTIQAQRVLGTIWDLVALAEQCDLFLTTDPDAF